MLAGFLLAVDIILGPIVLLLFLRRTASKASEPTFDAKFGVLYQSYRPTVRWFESAVLLKRWGKWFCPRLFTASVSLCRLAFVTIDTVLYGSSYRAYAFVLLNSTLLALHLFIQPYTTARENGLETTVLAVLAILSSTLIQVDANSQIDTGLAVWVAILVYIPSILLLGMVLRRMVQKFRAKTISVTGGVPSLKGPGDPASTADNEDVQEIGLTPIRDVAPGTSSNDLPGFVVSGPPSPAPVLQRMSFAVEVGPHSPREGV